MPGYQKPSILMKTSNTRVNKVITKLKNIVDFLNFFRHAIISKERNVIPATAKGNNSSIFPKEYFIALGYYLKIYKFQ